MADLDAIARLRRIASCDDRGLEPGDRQWLALVVRTYLAGAAEGMTLDEAAGVATDPGSRPWPGVGESHRLAGYQIVNLRAQLMDVGQGLLTGQSPLQVLLQQGGQITGVFGPGQGGVLGILRGIGQAIPRGIGIGAGLAGLGIVAGSALNQAQQQGIDERRSLSGVGMRAGLSPVDVERLSTGGQYGETGPFGLSRSQARDIVSGMSGSGIGEAGITRGLGLDTDIRRQVIEQNDLTISKALTEQLRTTTMTMETETLAVGRSAAEAARLTFATQARIAASQGGKAVSEQVAAQIDREASAYSRLVDVLGRTKVADQLRFDRAQLGRNSGDTAIASNLRSQGLGSIDDPKNASLVSDMRTSAMLTEAKSTLTTGISGLLTDLRQGTKPADALLNQAGRVADRGINAVTDQAVSALFKQGMGAFGLDTLKSTMTGTMTVTAGSVMVNGGVGGLSPGGTAPIGNVTRADLPNLSGAGRVTSDTDALAGVPIKFDTPGTAGILPDWLSAGKGTKLFSDRANDIGDGLRPDLKWGLADRAAQMQSEGAGVVDALRDTRAGIGSQGSSLVDALGQVGKGLGGSDAGIGSLIGSGAKGAGSEIPLGGEWFATGGYTGPGGRLDPAGVVHRGEYVFSASSVDRIGVGTLEAMHRGLPGYAAGGYVAAPLPPIPHAVPVAPGSYAAPVVNMNITNHVGGQVEAQTSRGPNGEINMDVLVRHVDARLARRTTRGQGDMGDAAAARAAGGAAYRNG